MDELESYDLRDPAALIGEVAGWVALTAGSTHLVLIQNPSTEQRIVSVQKLRRRARSERWEAARDEMHAKIQAWDIPNEVPPTHSATLVVARHGLCVIGYEELGWLEAWRYVNHWQRLYSGGLILVTEHGWLDWDTCHAGQTPALWLARSAAG